jgi:hypothetical protein
VALFTVEGQVACRSGEPAGGGQIARGQCGLGGEVVGVGQLHSDFRPHRQRSEHLGAPQHALRGAADVAAGQLDRGELVQCGALNDRVLDAAGELNRLQGEGAAARVEVGDHRRLGCEHLGLRSRVAAGQRPCLGEQRLGGPVRGGRS